MKHQENTETETKVTEIPGLGSSIQLTSLILCGAGTLNPGKSISLETS